MTHIANQRAIGASGSLIGRPGGEAGEDQRKAKQVGSENALVLQRPETEHPEQRLGHRAENRQVGEPRPFASDQDQDTTGGEREEIDEDGNCLSFWCRDGGRHYLGLPRAVCVGEFGRAGLGDHSGGEVGGDRSEALSGNVIHHIQHPEPPSAGELIMDEIQRPAGVCTGFDQDRGPCAKRLAACFAFVDG